MLVRSVVRLEYLGCCAINVEKRCWQVLLIGITEAQLIDIGLVSMRYAEHLGSESFEADQRGRFLLKESVTLCYLVSQVHALNGLLW